MSYLTRFLKTNFSLQLPNIAALIFYGIFGIALLSPLAADSFLPKAPDFANHTGIIVQAKMALDEGQFPLLVAPWQFSGWRLPLFQFYSPMPYTFAAFIYKWIVPENPYLALKLMLWLSLTISGIFIYKSAFWLTRSRIAAFLSGTVYMAAPYFLININARGAFTEAVAQGVLPVLLYFNLRGATSSKLHYILLSAIAWFVLATTHIITFIYFTLFVGILFILISIKKRSRLVKFSIAFVLGCALSLYFLAPVALANDLQIKSIDALNNPYDRNWLTPIETLLSPTSVSPVPGPMADPMQTANLNPAVGWPILLAVGVVAYYLLSQLPLPYKVGTYRLVFHLLFLFGLVFFMTWSPVDFWSFLPRQLWVIQFPYRLLAQITWIGSMLFAYAVAIMVGTHFNIRSAVIGLLLIQLSFNSYLPTPLRSEKELNTIIHNPDVGYGSGAYLISPERYPSATSYGSIELPATYTDGWLMQDYDFHVHLHPSMISPKSTLHLEGIVASELSDGTTLSVFISGRKYAQKMLESGPFVWNLDLKDVSYKKGFSLKFISSNTFTTPTDKRDLAISVQSLLVQNLNRNANTLPLKDTESRCSRKGVETYCALSIPPTVSVVQLPALFYPNLLDVRVDGIRVAYLPLVHRQYLLVGVPIQPGFHNISVKFTGLSWARWVSLVSWIGLILTWFLNHFFIFKRNNLSWINRPNKNL